ncbi:hypothetical protein EGH21_18980 [Halomicroarcula sp. F13]|uniref:Uncharacterized protein n=1 Tax=Haloarcula rubra TaxID=2487747 RepID=A0AAW4PY01_9EURY|nr:hypothetical protein [Halomicroarcula rubra]MBX0325117.1 hypothetical protein [Halomicroarcula rubra]
MATTQANPQERIARQLPTQSPSLFLGVDGDTAHYWESYECTVAVVPREAILADDAEVFRLDETPRPTLDDGCQHVRRTRGWNVGPRVDGSLMGDLARGGEA